MTVISYTIIEDAMPHLVKQKQWVCWVYTEREDANGDPHPTKMPIDAKTGEPGNAGEGGQDTWSSFETACDFNDTHAHIDGIGYVFSPGDDIYGIDWDDAYDPETGEWIPQVREYIRDIGSYTEISPSGEGAHTIVAGEKPGDDCRTGLPGDVGIEVYEEGRFFTVTGDHVEFTPTAVATEPVAFEDIYADIFGSSSVDSIHADVQAQLEASVEVGDSDRTADLDDSEIIELACNAKNGNDFESLFGGSIAGYESHSEARMAFLFHLAFWTGKDAQQMESIYKESGLYYGKYIDKFERLGDHEIGEAITKTTTTYTPAAGGTGGITTDDATETAKAAMLESMDELAAASELDKSSDQSAREDEIIDTYAKEYASELYVINEDGGLSDIARRLSDDSRFFTVTEVKRRIQKAISNVSPQDVGTWFDTVIEDRLDRVVKIQTTDSTADTSYQWKFDTFTFETAPKHDTRPHFNWSTFRDIYHEACGDYPGPPSPQYQDMSDWKNFIVRIMDEYGTVHESVGPRTEAVDALRNEIARSKGYGELSAATTRSGVYLDGEDGDELWIPNSRIISICNEAEITPRALQAELTDRKHTIEDRNGVSLSTNVNGDRITFWVLDADFQEPTEYIDDPMAEQSNEPTGDIHGDTEYGIVDSVGVEDE